MKQERWEELRGAYLADRLAADEREAFESLMQEQGLTRGDLENDLLVTGAMRAAMDDAYPGDLEERTLDLVRTGVNELNTTAASSGSTRRFLEWIRGGEFRIPVPAAIAAALLLMLSGGLLMRGIFPTVPAPTFTDTGQSAVTLAAGEVESEIRSLLGRARTLLLALTTAIPDENGDYHLVAEQELSRDLIRDVRLLGSRNEMENGDEVLSLVRDLEAILLDVATWDGIADTDRMAVLQGGIKDRSLIWRLNTYEQEFGGN